MGRSGNSFQRLCSVIFNNGVLLPREAAKSYFFSGTVTKRGEGRAWTLRKITTVCPGSSDPPEKILNIFESENEVYTIF